ncbi:hypothetical protein [Thermoactinomyces sp. DSM 45892]|uniref:hypothetical protein n=1 Tax=Thermoactinomyces sp. DSM 45892 TaxID=1882753 RepID=UPI000897AE02|nr:hypothetical protein [Thermoactinomyces sp. DSM 45892]SDY17578.1 hypothetical protein SAMN05444416_102212 [Thermoactinomyces sp. DSM 45892]
MWNKENPKKIIAYREIDSHYIVLQNNGQIHKVNNTNLQLLGVKKVESDIITTRIDHVNLFLFSPTIAFLENHFVLDKIKIVDEMENRARPSFTSYDSFNHSIQEIICSGTDHFHDPDPINTLIQSTPYPLTIQILVDDLHIHEDMLLTHTFTSFTLCFDLIFNQKKTKNGKIDFSGIRAVKRDLQKWNIDLRLFMSIQLMDSQEIEETIQLCLDHRLPRPQILETHPIGKALSHSHIILQKEYLSLLESITNQNHTTSII